MTYEIVDIVDENDLVIGTIERTPEWNKNRTTIHRYVNVFVRLSDGRFVLQQRAAHKARPLVFDCAVGGLVSSGMTYEQAAQKELKEEMGLDETVNLVGSFTDLNGTDKISAFAQLFEVVSDGPFSGWEEEAVRLEVFTLEEMDHLSKRFPYLFTNGFLEAWDLYKRFKQ